MWMEELLPEIDSSEWGWQSAEAIKASAEKYKESSKKAWAKIAKTSKDEKKAKKYDFLLAWFLVKIIIDKKYDFLLDSLFWTISKWFSSNFVLWILSLINLDISNKIREISKKQNIVFQYKTKIENTIFNNDHIDQNIQNRINSWTSDIIDSISIEYSSLQTKKLKQLLISNSSEITIYSKTIFIFFLKEINISISDEQANQIINYILTQVQNHINKLNIEEI